MNGSIFQNFPKLEPKLAQIQKNFEKKLGDFTQNLAKNWGDWYMNRSLFLEKIGIFMGLLSNFAACPYQNQT